MANNKKLQDVVPHRSVRNIPVPEKRRSIASRANESLDERNFLIEQLSHKHNRRNSIVDDANEEYDDDVTNNNAHHTFAKWGIWVIATAAVVFFAFSVILFFAGATVTVTPKKVAVPINTVVSAYPDTGTSNAGLTYQTITMTEQATTTVPVSTSTPSTIDQKASGKITIFNSYSAQPQTLVANTRFESSNGLIYHIQTAVKVPGFQTKNGVVTPGTLDVTVFADKPGPQYNLVSSDFTIPGLKTNLLHYQKVIARSKTPIAGGLLKGQSGASATVLNSATLQLQASLKDQLLREAKAQKPVDSVLYDASYSIDYAPVSQTKNLAGETVISEQGTIHALVFNKKSLSQAVLGDAIASVGNEVEVRGLEALTFAPQHLVAGTSLWQQTPLQFALSGSLTVVGLVDADKLATDLAGQNKTDIQTILKQYPTIDHVVTVIRPFWKSAFPTDTAKIKVQIVNP